MQQPARFRKRPVVIRAIQWTGDNQAAIADFLGTSPGFNLDSDGHWFEIETLEGPLRASKGDWIIEGIGGEFYPHKPDLFPQAYDPED